jgi:hypothetical protein
VIQREAIGLRDHTMLTTEYGVAPEVWRSMGIVETPALPSSTEL